MSELKLKGGDWSKRCVPLAGLCRWKLLKHQSTPLHQAAHALLVGDNGVDPCEHGAVPKKEEWAKVLNDTLRGNATSVSGVAAVGSRKKVRFMQWCLAEGKRELHRAALLAAGSISISYDKRGTRFLVRFRCADARLQVCTGILSIMRRTSGNADDIRGAVLLAVQTALQQRPSGRGTADTAVPVDPAGLVKVVGRVEHIVADAEAAPQLAARELGPQMGLAGPDIDEVRESLLQALPALKAIRKTHESPCCVWYECVFVVFRACGFLALITASGHHCSLVLSALHCRLLLPLLASAIAGGVAGPGPRCSEATAMSVGCPHTRADVGA